MNQNKLKNTKLTLQLLIISITIFIICLSLIFKFFKNNSEIITKENLHQLDIMYKKDMSQLIKKYDLMANLTVNQKEITDLILKDDNKGLEAFLAYHYKDDKFLENVIFTDIKGDVSVSLNKMKDYGKVSNKAFWDDIVNQKRFKSVSSSPYISESTQRPVISIAYRIEDLNSKFLGLFVINVDLLNVFKTDIENNNQLSLIQITDNKLGFVAEYDLRQYHQKKQITEMYTLQHKIPKKGRSPKIFSQNWGWMISSTYSLKQAIYLKLLLSLSFVIFLSCLIFIFMIKYQLNSKSKVHYSDTNDSHQLHIIEKYPPNDYSESNQNSAFNDLSTRLRKYIKSTYSGAESNNSVYEILSKTKHMLK